MYTCLSSSRHMAAFTNREPSKNATTARQKHKNPTRSLSNPLPPHQSTQVPQAIIMADATSTANTLTTDTPVPIAPLV